jgi:alpha-1,3-rhamnosyl/mannosyltransferase
VGGLRIAVVADVLLLEMGGVGRAVLGVTRELARLDSDRVSITVVAKRRPASIDGLPYRRSFAPHVPRLPDALFAIQRPLTLRTFDVVHYIDSRPPVDFMLGRVPKVITQHGFAALMFGSDHVPAKERRLNQVLLRLAPFADRTILCSESERREFLSRAPEIDPSSVVPIHHGVEHDQFNPGDLEDARGNVARLFGLDRPYVLYVSNHQRKKNAERLVTAFARVAERVSDVDLAMVGFHTSKFVLVSELIEQLGVGDRVRVLGHVPDESLPDLYRAAELFALPSLHEGFGLPLLEAMACDTPVLTSKVYSMPEVAGDAAHLVDPYSVDEIAAGMERILDDRAYAADLRARGLTRAAGFTWRRSAEQHVAVYEAVAGR